jgi:hypothetical protein
MERVYIMTLGVRAQTRLVKCFATMHAYAKRPRIRFCCKAKTPVAGRWPRQKALDVARCITGFYERENLAKSRVS